jgi:hypothetical protein
MADLQVVGYSSLGMPNGTSVTIYPTLHVNLGSCADFAVLAGTSITFSSVLSVISTGNVGSATTTAVTGNYLTDAGSTQLMNAHAVDCAVDQQLAYSIASSSTCTTTFATPELSGKTLSPGVYCTGGTITIAASGILVLDGKNKTSSIWIFIAKSTLTTSAYSAVILTNQAQVLNVFWSSASSVMLGASSFFVGQILTLTTVEFGAQSTLKGRALAAASISLDGGSMINLAANSSQENVTVGRCHSFSILAGTTITFGTGMTQISSGSIGVSPGSATLISGSYSLTSGTPLVATPATVACAIDISVAYNAASTAFCLNQLTSGELSGLVLSPSVYCSTDFTIAKIAYLTLDGRNIVNPVWVFQSTTLSTQDDSSVILKNGALSKNVYWAVSSTVSLGYSSFIVGNILSLSAIAVGSFVTVDGRVLCLAGVSVEGYGSFGLPNGASAVVYPSLNVHLALRDDSNVQCITDSRNKWVGGVLFRQHTRWKQLLPWRRHYADRNSAH